MFYKVQKPLFKKKKLHNENNHKREFTQKINSVF